MSRRRRRQEKKIREQKTEPYWCGVCHEEHEDGKEGVKCGKCGRMSHCVETYAKWQKCCVCSAKLRRKYQKTRLDLFVDVYVERTGLARLTCLEKTILYGFIVVMSMLYIRLEVNYMVDMYAEDLPGSKIGIMTLKLPVYPKPEGVYCGESWTAESMPMGSWTEGMWKLRGEE